MQMDVLIMLKHECNRPWPDKIGHFFFKSVHRSDLGMKWGILYLVCYGMIITVTWIHIWMYCIVVIVGENPFLVIGDHLKRTNENIIELMLNNNLIWLFKVIRTLQNKTLKFLLGRTLFTHWRRSGFLRV